MFEPQRLGGVELRAAVDDALDQVPLGVQQRAAGGGPQAGECRGVGGDRLGRMPAASQLA
jgi:hypothetical protein